MERIGGWFSGNVVPVVRGILRGRSLSDFCVFAVASGSLIGFVVIDGSGDTLCNFFETLDGGLVWIQEQILSVFPLTIAVASCLSGAKMAWDKFGGSPKPGDVVFIADDGISFLKALG